MLVTIAGASKTEFTLEEILAMLLTHEQQIRAEVEQETVPVYGIRNLSFKGKSKKQPRKNQPPVQQRQQGSSASSSRSIDGNRFYCEAWTYATGLQSPHRR